MRSFLSCQFLAAWRLVDHREHLVEALDLHLGFVGMLLERGSQFVRMAALAIFGRAGPPAAGSRPRRRTGSSADRAVSKAVARVVISKIFNAALNRVTPPRLSRHSAPALAGFLRANLP